MSYLYVIAFCALVFSVNMQAFNGDVRGKTCIVTGATSGIGKETAFNLAAQGCKVIAAARNEDAFLAMMREKNAPSHNMSFLYLDLSSLQSVISFVDKLAKNQIAIDVLVNNAGVFQKELVTTKDGLESSLQVNYLAPFLLTETMFKKGIINENAVILNIVSERLQLFSLNADVWSSYGGGIDWSSVLGGDAAYARSKLMMLMYSLWLARNALATHPSIRIMAFHPGGVKTKIYDNLPLGLGKFVRLFMKSPERVAQEIYTILTADPSPKGDEKQVLFGTSLGYTISRFALSEINQDHLIEETRRILSLYDGEFVSISL